MRIARTSAIVFLSKLLSSVLGFAATVYFARALGAEVLGVYAAVIAFTTWLQLGTTGVGEATKKRISEGDEQDQYFSAGLLFVAVLYVLIVVLLLVGRGFVEGYLDNFETFVDVSVVWFVILLLGVRLGLTVGLKALNGVGLVHVQGLLQPVRIGLRSLFQVVLVFLGFKLLGMLVGYILGGTIVTLVAVGFVSLRLRRPSKDHFRSLFDYAKYSWFGSLKSRTFRNADILVLEALVASSLVGIYSVSWSISTVLNTFGGAIGQSVFPEISQVSEQEGTQKATGIVEDALAYTGLLVIPGVVGGFLLDDLILDIYSGEFVRGTEVLSLLLLSVLFYNYMRQFLTTLNAIDRPDLAFNVNVVFVGTNVGLNVVLIHQIGWVGAAIASLTSTGVGLLLGYASLSRLLPLDLPLGEIARQVSAALIMGVVVWFLRLNLEQSSRFSVGFLVLVALVCLGAGTYVVVLSALSADFRTRIRDNLVGFF